MSKQLLDLWHMNNKSTNMITATCTKQVNTCTSTGKSQFLLTTAFDIYFNNNLIDQIFKPLIIQTDYNIYEALTYLTTITRINTKLVKSNAAKQNTAMDSGSWRLDWSTDG